MDEIHSGDVVVTSGTGNSTILDGVTVTGRHADGAIPSDYDKGAGVLNLNGSPTFRTSPLLKTMPPTR